MIERLIQKLTDKSGVVRAEAAEELYFVEDKQAAVPALLKALAEESDDHVRELVVDALGATGDVRAVEPILQKFTSLDDGASVLVPVLLPWVD